MKKKLKERLIERILDLLDENQRLKDLLQENNVESDNPTSGDNVFNLLEVKKKLFIEGFVSADGKVCVKKLIAEERGTDTVVPIEGVVEDATFSGCIVAVIKTKTGDKIRLGTDSFLLLREWESNS